MIWRLSGFVLWLSMVGVFDILCNGCVLLGLWFFYFCVYVGMRVVMFGLFILFMCIGIFVLWLLVNVMY